MADVALLLMFMALRTYIGIQTRRIQRVRVQLLFQIWRSKVSVVLLVTVTPSPAPDASGSSFQPSNDLVLLTNRFCWFGAGALGVERQRTGLKLGSGSEPALELSWWKRGRYGAIQHQKWFPCDYEPKNHFQCYIAHFFLECRIKVSVKISTYK